MLAPELDGAIRARINQVPIISMLAMEITRLDEGYCEARTPRRPEYDGIFASMHGGLLMTVADTVACWAVLTGVGAESRIDLNTFEVTDPSFRRVADVNDGVLTISAN